MFKTAYRDIAKSVKAQDFDSCISLVRVQLSQPKIREQSSRIFHLCHRHNIICVAHATSFDRQVNFIAALRGTNERCCNKLQMMCFAMMCCFASMKLRFAQTDLSDGCKYRLSIFQKSSFLFSSTLTVLSFLEFFSFP